MYQQPITMDLRKVPFSRRGSLACLYESKEADGMELLFALFENFGKSERVIKEMYPIDEEGKPLGYETVFYPHMLQLQLSNGKRLDIAFSGENALLFRLPEGVGFHMFFPGRMLNMVWKGSELLMSDSLPLMYYAMRAKGEPAIQWDSRHPIPNSPPRSAVELQVPAGETMRTFEFHFAQEEIVPPLQPACFESAVSKSLDEWKDWVAPIPEVEESYRPNLLHGLYALYVNLLPSGGQMAYEGGCPSKANFYGIWPWDTCFQTLGYQHLDMELAQNQIRLLLDGQLENGMLPDIIHHRAVKATCTKPPVEAWAAWRLYEKSRDLRFLKDVYPGLVRINQWWRRERDYDKDGICQYNHYWDGGWDNSPVYDKGMPVESPDLNAHLIVQMDRLSRIAGELGYAEECRSWKEEAMKLTERLIAHSYDSDKGYFLARKDTTHEYVDTLTLINVLPLIIPDLDRAIVKRLVEHLTNPEQFWGRYGLPTVAYNDPRYSEDYWRGPIWLNMNFVMIEALLQHGYPEEAIVLRDRTLQVVAENNGLLENYDSTTGKGQNAELFGWTTAVYIHLCIQKAKGEIV